MAVPEWLGADPSVIHVDHRDATPGRRGQWPAWLADEHRQRFAARGVEAPWEHQVQVAELMHAGRHVAVSTPTASGKTLAYLMAVIADTAPGRDGAGAVRAAPVGGASPAAGQGSARAGRAAAASAARRLLGVAHEPTALYLAPTKALAHDQRRTARDLGPRGWQVAALDGDSDAAARRFAREHAGFVLTNPDMLHHAILPQHGRWARLLGGLRYVVIDEGHRYRGVFGAQVACVIRRLRRLCQAYGSDPVFVVASATSVSAGESAARLIGEPEPIAEVSRDAAPHPARDVVLWRPEGDVYADATALLTRLVDANGRGGVVCVLDLLDKLP